MNEVVIDDSQREMCAVLVMRTMLTDYCNDTSALLPLTVGRLDGRCHKFVTDQILDVGHIRIQPCTLLWKHLIGHDDISGIHRGLVRGFAPDLCFDVLILLLVVDLSTMRTAKHESSTTTSWKHWKT